MESKDRLKRPRQEEQSENNNIDGGGNSSSDEKPPPPYGSQDYWEERYKRMKESKNNDYVEDPDPFHAWYFNYEELAPILMPLILGEGVDDGNNGDEEPGDEDVEGDVIPQEQKEVVNGKEYEVVGRSKNIDKNKQQIRNQNCPSENGEIQAQPVDATTTTEEGDGEFTGQDDDEAEGDCENDDEYEEVGGGDDGDDEDDDEGEDAAPIRIGLAKDGPISILEVGCGDVPLGRDLAKGIAELESVAGVQVTKILKRVVCSDYSKCVIETLNEEQQKNWNLSIPLTYEVVDARKMPYGNESFEMLIDKGTLDAMLSDRDKGADNCISIVSECARVLAVGGYFVLVSHLNAHAQKGLQWLDDIVIPGLRMGVRDNSNGYKWNIEVHGNDADVPSDKDEGADDMDENNNDGDSVEEQSHGPAVYVIQKIPHTKSNSTDTTMEKGTDKPLPIDLRFFSY